MRNRMCRSSGQLKGLYSAILGSSLAAIPEFVQFNNISSSLTTGRRCLELPAPEAMAAVVSLSLHDRPLFWCDDISALAIGSHRPLPL